MSETKFTKGEWIFNGNEIVTKEAPNKGIAGAMTDADCHLIAAAPDMYGLLEEARDALGTIDARYIEQLTDDINAALAKARGEHETD